MVEESIAFGISLCLKICIQCITELFEELKVLLSLMSITFYQVSDWTLRMGKNEQMPKVDLVKDKANISRITIDYMKILEKENVRRVQALQKLRQRNIKTGCILGAGVLGIYLYTIFSVRQEKFLDDFDEPAITSN
jgi:hypothetical protein